MSPRQQAWPIVWIYILSFLFCAFCVRAQKVDCCTAQYSSFGLSCKSDVVYNNTTYYCMSTSLTCDTCSLATNVVTSKCSSCCVTSTATCDDDFSSNAYFSAWTLVLMVFAVSCFCCALVFLTAEQSRMKDGMTFHEAYLLPIPIVTAETDLENKDIVFPRDQPTAIARPHTSIDVPVAEPTEYSPLLFR